MIILSEFPINQQSQEASHSIPKKLVGECIKKNIEYVAVMVL
jgi:hypothetical protein